MAIENTYVGNGITLVSGFDYAAKAPLDARAVVATDAGLTALVSGNAAYEGMLVYVETTQKTWQYTKIKNEETGEEVLGWKEFGFNNADFEEGFTAGLVDNLESDSADKALTAKQGKVLKGLIDANTEDIGEHETRIGALEGAITGAMHFVGVSTTDPAGENGVTIEGKEDYVAVSGDVVIYKTEDTDIEFVYDGTNWIELGDVNEEGRRLSALEDIIGDSNEGLVKDVADAVATVADFDKAINGDPDVEGDTGFAGVVTTANNNASEALRIAGEAKEAAQTAQNSATTKANEAAQSAADAANAKTASLEAQAAAETAQGAAETAKGEAQNAEAAAKGAQSAAETAQGKAEIAQGKAEEAQSAAETAQGKAEEAQGAAEEAATLAGQKAEAASVSAGQAAGSAQAAGEKAAEASGYAQTASQAKADAEAAKAAAVVAQGAAEAAQAAAEASNTSATAIATEAKGLAEGAVSTANTASGVANDAKTAVENLDSAIYGYNGTAATTLTIDVNDDGDKILKAAPIEITMSQVSDLWEQRHTYVEIIDFNVGVYQAGDTKYATKDALGELSTQVNVLEYNLPYELAAKVDTETYNEKMGLLDAKDAELAAAIEAAKKYADDNDANETFTLSYADTKIKLTGSNGTNSEIDATDFIKDGMIEKVELSEDGKNLVITWNSDADKGDKNVTTIPLTGLVDVYTGVDGNDIKVEVSADNKISATVKADALKTTLGLGALAYEDSVDTGVMKVEEGATNGTVAVDGTDVKVHGLGSAAFTDANDYAPADIDTGVHAVALTSGTNNGTLKLTVDSVETDNIAVTGLGSAAFTDAGAYATSAQGATADATAQTIAGYGDIVTHNASEYETAGTAQTLIEALDSSVAATAEADNKVSVLTGVTQTDGKLTAKTEVTLAAIAKTGNVNDLVQTDGDYLIFNCGTATTVI